MTAVSGHMTARSILLTRSTHCLITWVLMGRLSSSFQNIILWSRVSWSINCETSNMYRITVISVRRLEGCGGRWMYTLFFTIGSSNELSILPYLFHRRRHAERNEPSCEWKRIFRPSASRSVQAYEPVKGGGVIASHVQLDCSHIAVWLHTAILVWLQ